MPELSVAGADPSAVFSRAGLRASWIWRGRSAASRATPRSRATRLADAFDELGGLYSAYANFLKWRTDLLPSEYILALGKVKDSAPPIPREAFAQVLISTLGMRGEVLAANLEPKPCWSTLQRCAYRTSDAGNTLVAQIAKPAVSADAFRHFEQSLRRLNDPHIQRAASPSTLAQFREWLEMGDGTQREVAFLNAMQQNGATVAEYPRLIPDLCSGNILCWPWMEGDPLSKLIAKGSPVALQKLSEFVLEQICVLAVADADLDLDALALRASSKLIVRRATRFVSIPQPAMRACLKYVSAVLKGDSPSAAHFLVSLAYGQVGIDLESRLIERLANLEPELKVNARFPASAGIFESNWRGLAGLRLERPLFLDTMHGNLMAVGYCSAQTGAASDCIADAHLAVMGRLLYSRVAALSDAGHLSDWLVGSGLLLAEGMRQLNRVADGLRADDLAIRVALGLPDDGAAKINRLVRNGIGMAMLLLLFLISMRWIVAAPTPLSTLAAGTAALAAIGVLWILIRLV